MYVSPDKHSAAVFAFSHGTQHWSDIVPRYRTIDIIVVAITITAMKHNSKANKHTHM